MSLLYRNYYFYSKSYRSASFLCHCCTGITIFTPNRTEVRRFYVTAVQELLFSLQIVQMCVVSMSLLYRNYYFHSKSYRSASFLCHCCTGFYYVFAAKTSSLIDCYLMQIHYILTVTSHFKNVSNSHIIILPECGKDNKPGYHMSCGIYNECSSAHR